MIPCYGRLPLVDPATGLEYNCGLYGGVECPQNSFCHHTQTFAKCCPKGIHECVILECYCLATSNHTNLETEYETNNCTGCCTTDDQDMVLEHPVAAPNSDAGPDSPKGCPLHCKCNPLGTIWILLSCNSAVGETLHYFLFPAFLFLCTNSFYNCTTTYLLPLIFAWFLKVRLAPFVIPKVANVAAHPASPVSSVTDVDRVSGVCREYLCKIQRDVNVRLANRNANNDIRRRFQIGFPP